jgi:hypothetical protein
MIAAATSLGIAAIGGAAASASAPADVALKQIQVPTGNKTVAEMQANGVQTYQCINRQWKYLQPDAILTSDGKPVVVHSRGPVWTSVTDGSSVTARVIRSEQVNKELPNLLLEGSSHRGPGQLSDITYIQRVNTTGGLAPAGTCRSGSTVSVSYSAKYTFWTSSNKK